MVRFHLDPPVEEMRAGSLQHHHQISTKKIQKTHLSWGQLKRLNQDTAKTLDPMFLAMLAILSTMIGAIFSENLTHHYWTYASTK